MGRLSGFGGAAVAGAVFGLSGMFCAAGAVLADPAAPGPSSANCTAGDLAQVSSQVGAATANYLFAHPDVNDFFTSQKGKAPDELRDDLKDYMDAHPQVHSDLEGIRKPLNDHRHRCQEPDEPE